MGYAVMSTDQLWELYSQDRSDEGLIEELTKRYIPMVRAIVHRFALPVHAVEDALQSAFIGLLEAFQHFDPRKGCKFGTFGQHRVWGAVVDYIRMQPWNQVHYSRGQQKNILKLQALEEGFAAEYQRSPNSDRELAEFAGLPLATVKEIRWLEHQASSQIHLDAPGHNPSKPEGEVGSFAEIVELFDSNYDYELVDTSDERAMLYAFIKLLPDQYRIVLYYYFYQELTMKRIAEIVGLSQARISQIVDKAIRKLREAYAMPQHLKRFIVAFVNESEDDASAAERPRVIQQRELKYTGEEGTELVARNLAQTKDPPHSRGYSLVLAVAVYVWKKAPERLHIEGIKSEIGLDVSPAAINSTLMKLKAEGVLIGTEKRGVYQRGKVHHVLFLGSEAEAVLPNLLPDFIAQPRAIYDINELAEQIGVTPNEALPPTPPEELQPSERMVVTPKASTTPTNGKAHSASSFDYTPIALRTRAEGLRVQAALLLEQAATLEEAARIQETFDQARKIMEGV